MKTKLLLLLAVFMTAFSVNSQTISIVGEAAGGWPGEPGNPGPTDVHQMTSTDGINWTYAGLVLTNAGEVSGCSGANCGGVKFRQDNSWTTNWGSASFPSGTGTQNGTNIQCLVGTYDVTFNRQTGAYTFTDGLSNADFNKSTFKAYPNPSNSVWNFESSNEIITSVIVYDVLGKVVAQSNTTTIDASSLNRGVYFAKVSTDLVTETIKVLKN